MRVSDEASLDRVAIVGGFLREDFGISDSASFFDVLSSSLYSDKKRAVVREVMCNGWDGHAIIDNQKTPLEIDITNEALTIKDFGPGIEVGRIAGVYCFYGSSTRTEDEKQNGGFGLGSKAPFAYADYFTVISRHGGIQATYLMTRTDPVTGKPSVRCMSNTPCADTGVTVIIPIDTADAVDFRKLVRSVAREGGISTNLNGETVEIYNFQKARKLGFAFVPVVALKDSVPPATIRVVYGSVSYPLVTTEDDIRHLIERMRQAVCLCGKYAKQESQDLVLFAPPGSLSVTPSRESLSFSALTKKTLAALADNLVKLIDGENINSTSSMFVPKPVTAKYIDTHIRHALSHLSDHREYVDDLSKISAISRHRRCGLGDTISLDTRKVLFNYIAGIYPSARRDLKAAIFRPLARYDRNFNDNLVYRRIKRALRVSSMRSVIRAAARADVLNDIRVKTRANGVTKHHKLNSNTLWSALGDREIANTESLRLVIARNVTTALGQLREQDVGVFMSLSPSMTKKRASAEKHFTLAGIAVTVVNEVVQPVKVVKIDNEKFTDAANKFSVWPGHSQGDIDYREQAKTLVRPKHYIDLVGVSYTQINKENYGVGFVGDIAKMFSDVALIRTVKQRTEAESLGAVEVLDVIFKEFYRLLGTVGGAFGEYTHSHNNRRRYGTTLPGNIVQSADLIVMLAGLSAVQESNALRVLDILELINRMRYFYGHPRHEIAVCELQKVYTRNCVVKFSEFEPQMRNVIEAASVPFGHITSGYHITTRTDAAEVAAMLRILKRQKNVVVKMPKQEQIA
jgi:hypothetical protein